MGLIFVRSEIPSHIDLGTLPCFKQVKSWHNFWPCSRLLTRFSICGQFPICGAGFKQFFGHEKSKFCFFELTESFIAFAYYFKPPTNGLRLSENVSTKFWLFSQTSFQEKFENIFSFQFWFFRITLDSVIICQSENYLTTIGEYLNQLMQPTRCIKYHLSRTYRIIIKPDNFYRINIRETWKMILVRRGP